MDVRLPDGTTVKNVPEGMTQSQLMSKLQGAHQSGVDTGIDWGRMGAEFLGGVVGGAAGIPAGPMGIAAGTGLGAEAGGQMLDLSRQYLGGQPIQGSMLDRVANAAKSVGMNAAGQVAGVKVADVLGKGLSYLTSPASKRIFGAPAGQLVSDYQQAGVPLAAGPISGNRFIQGTESALSKMPGSAGVMKDYQTDFSQAIAEYADQVARMSGGIPTSTEGASEVLTKGAKAAADRFSKRYEQLNDVTEKLIGSDTYVRPDNMASLLDEMQSRYAQDPAALGYLAKPISYLRSIVKQNLPSGSPPTDTGTVSFGALRSARTHVGKSLDQPTISGYVGDEGAQFRRIYGAMTQDIEDAAARSGPDALNAWETANRYARSNLASRVPALDDMNSRASTAYKWLMSGSTDTGQRLAIMRQNLKPNEWDNVVATTVDRLGKATPGNQNFEGDLFSPSTFLKNWNKLSDGAKNALFGGNRYAGLRDGLDRLGRISESVKDTSYMQNPSGTAGANFFTNLLTDPVKAVVGLGMMGIPQNRLAKLFTNPSFVSWVAKGAQIAPTDYSALTAHIARIPSVAFISGDSDNGKTVQTTQGPVTVNQSYDVPLLGSGSKDRNTIYLDKDFNPIKDIGGKQVDVTPFLAEHEKVEADLEAKGYSYDKAHQHATDAEHALVSQSGINPSDYEAALKGDIASAEAKRKGAKTPPDMITKPYDHPHSQASRSIYQEVTNNEQ